MLVTSMSGIQMSLLYSEDMGYSETKVPRKFPR